MKDIEKQFIEATDRWCKNIREEKHNYLDCRWVVGFEKMFSDGKESKEGYWTVRHNGNITEFEEVGNTKESVMLSAIDFIDNFFETNEKL